MIYLVLLILVFALCLCGSGSAVSAIFLGGMIGFLGYGIHRYMHGNNWLYRKVVDENAEEARKMKYAKKNFRRYPSDRMFRNYYRTGDRNYLWNEDYRK